MNKKNISYKITFSLALIISFNSIKIKANQDSSSVNFESLFKDELTNEDNAFKVFEREIIKNKKVVVIKFSTKTCGPCIMSKKPFENLAKEFSSKALFVEFPADKYQRLSSNLKVFKVPTFMIYNQGKVDLRAEGMLALIQLKNYLTKLQ